MGAAGVLASVFRYPMMRLVRRLASEPLAHFALLGTLLFGLHAWLAPTAPGRRIDVDTSVLRGLRQDHLRRTGAPPTAAEEEALVERYVDSEVLYREALALGLDRGDVIVRRRLLQKMEFLNDALDPLAEPTDAELEGFLASHAERYALPGRVSLSQVFVSTDRHGERAESVAAGLLAQLRGGAEPAKLGDPFPRGRDFGPAAERDLAGVFGSPFASRVFELPPGDWSGPVRSSYGFHLVRVSSRLPAEPPRLDAVRAAVLRDWEEERRGERDRAALADIRRRYEIHVERDAAAAISPSGTTGPGVPAEAHAAGAGAETRPATR